VTEAVGVHDYPNRADLIGSVLPALKAARRALTPEAANAGLDRDAARQLDRLAGRLVQHLHFEHQTYGQIRSALHQEVLRYRAMAPHERPPAREFAAEAVDKLAKVPMHKTIYLGVENLELPHGTVVGNVTFVNPSRDAELQAAFSWLREMTPQLLCEVDVSAGTEDLLRERARDLAETALGLLRQHNLFGFMSKIYLDQVRYGLDGTWTSREGSKYARAGWWRNKPSPIPAKLDHPNLSTWMVRLSELSELYTSVAPGLRQRVDMCIGWLDVAAMSDRWRIIIPAIFSGMEALLVPESTGLKAEVVTVRSVAVHIALDHHFFDPSEIMTAYRLRSDLVHGTPTSEVLEGDATDAAEFRRLWAFGVLCDYLELADAIDATTVKDITAYLDQGKCNDACEWLKEHGGSAVVAEYRKVAPLREIARPDPSAG